MASAIFSVQWGDWIIHPCAQSGMSWERLALMPTYSPLPLATDQPLMPFAGVDPHRFVSSLRIWPYSDRLFQEVALFRSLGGRWPSMLHRASIAHAIAPCESNLGSTLASEPLAFAYPTGLKGIWVWRGMTWFQEAWVSRASLPSALLGHLKHPKFGRWRDTDPSVRATSRLMTSRRHGLIWSKRLAHGGALQRARKLSLTFNLIIFFPPQINQF